MTDSLLTEQSTKLVGQIIDDLEKLKDEFLELNLAEVYEKYPSTAAISFLALNNIKTQMYTAFVFLEGMRKAQEEESVD